MVRFDLRLAPHERIDLARHRQFVEVDGVFLERVAARFLAATLVARSPPLAFLSRRAGLTVLFGHAMRDVVDDVQTGDVLLAEQVNGMGILFTEDRDQHVRTGDFLSPGGLHVVNRPLQHPLEGEGGLRVPLVAGSEHGHRLGDHRLELATQHLEVGAHCAQDLGRRGVVEQGEKQMLDGHELMTLLPCLLVAQTDGELEIFAEHGTLSSFRSLMPVPSCKAGDAGDSARTR